jgi:predicted acetyltransferase
MDLRMLRYEDEAAFLRAYAATKFSDPNFAHYYLDGMPFRDYVDLLARYRLGQSLPRSQVPSTFLLAFVEGEIVGRLSLRHGLNDFLLTVGGHIGYIVLPEYRRRGYATEMLRRSLPMARNLGIDRVLLTCDDGNIASRRTIEKCGGVYENSYEGPLAAHPKRRYWIPC